MKNLARSGVIALTLCLLFTSPALLANPGNGNGNGNGNGKGNGHAQGHGNKGEGKHDKSQGKKNKGGDPWRAEADISYSFARDLARQQGLTGYSSLPPGIAKNLARGKPLPPGIAKRSVPRGMLEGLPSYPGYEWKMVGDNLVLIALSTAVVTAIINNVFD
ncbi:anti-virulence regulator CigR family protein [Pantoea sp. USHLN298]|uniref:anti-virulence regulator CigR family protein n=1 Tax=Pantoea sp. USHLN298 TaxID=3081294 RepID=UPI003019616C